MAGGGHTVENPQRGEETTRARITPTLNVTSLIVRLHYVILSPLIVLTVPEAALYQTSAVIVVAIAAVGISGTLSGRPLLSTLASISLLAVLIWGKVSETALKAGSEDTAVLLLKFTLILFFMEASSAVLAFNNVNKGLEDKQDEISQEQRGRLVEWLRGRLSRQAKISMAITGLSVALLPLAGFTSIENTQLAFTATMLLVSVMILLFLLTHRREPERK